VAHLERWAKKHAMLLPRDKIQIGLVFLGLFLVGFGIALVQPGAKEEEIVVRSNAQGVGFSKDVGVTVATGRKIGPWVIGCGVATFVAAYLNRER
jgi:hypothetical protein